MPWPKSSVPKFGNWEKSEDLSYSIIFDKARAEKERFLHLSDSDFSSEQSFYKNSNVEAGKKTLFPDTARANRERFFPTLEQDKAFTRMHPNGFQNPQVTARRGASHAPTHNASFPPDGPSRQPLQVGAPKGTAFLNGRQHFDQADGGFHERLHAKTENIPGKFMYAENPPIAKMKSSQGGLETSRIADVQRKHAVPRFGDWDSGEAFTAAFNKARNEKSSKYALHPGVKAVSPLRADEDLYKSSETFGGSAEREKRRGWFGMICCSSGVA